MVAGKVEGKRSREMSLMRWSDQWSEVSRRCPWSGGALSTMKN